jgi:hypothetical protein
MRFAVGDAYSHPQRLLGLRGPIASAMAEVKRTQRHVAALAKPADDPSYSNAASDLCAINGS